MILYSPQLNEFIVLLGMIRTKDLTDGHHWSFVGESNTILEKCPGLTFEEVLNQFEWSFVGYL